MALTPEQLQAYWDANPQALQDAIASNPSAFGIQPSGMMSGFGGLNTSTGATTPVTQTGMMSNTRSITDINNDILNGIGVTPEEAALVDPLEIWRLQQASNTAARSDTLLTPLAQQINPNLTEEQFQEAFAERDAIQQSAQSAPFLPAFSQVDPNYVAPTENELAFYGRLVEMRDAGELTPEQLQQVQDYEVKHGLGGYRTQESAIADVTGRSSALDQTLADYGIQREYTDAEGKKYYLNSTTGEYDLIYDPTQDDIAKALTAAAVIGSSVVNPYLGAAVAGGVTYGQGGTVADALTTGGTAALTAGVLEGLQPKGFISDVLPDDFNKIYSAQNVAGSFVQGTTNSVITQAIANGEISIEDALKAGLITTGVDVATDIYQDAIQTRDAQDLLSGTSLQGSRVNMTPEEALRLQNTSDLYGLLGEQGLLSDLGLDVGYLPTDLIGGAADLLQGFTGRTTAIIDGQEYRVLQDEYGDNFVVNPDGTLNTTITAADLDVALESGNLFDASREGNLLGELLPGVDQNRYDERYFDVTTQRDSDAPQQGIFEENPFARQGTTFTGFPTAGSESTTPTSAPITVGVGEDVTAPEGGMLSQGTQDNVQVTPEPTGPTEYDGETLTEVLTDLDSTLDTQEQPSPVQEGQISNEALLDYWEKNPDKLEEAVASNPEAFGVELEDVSTEQDVEEEVQAPTFEQKLEELWAEDPEKLAQAIRENPEAFGLTEEEETESAEFVEEEEEEEFKEEEEEVIESAVGGTDTDVFTDTTEVTGTDTGVVTDTTETETLPTGGEETVVTGVDTDVVLGTTETTGTDTTVDTGTETVDTDTVVDNVIDDLTSGGTDVGILDNSIDDLLTSTIDDTITDIVTDTVTEDEVVPGGDVTGGEEVIPGGEETTITDVEEVIPTTTEEVIPTTTTTGEEVIPTTTTGEEVIPTTTTTDEEVIPTTTTTEEVVPTTTTPTTTTETPVIPTTSTPPTPPTVVVTDPPVQPPGPPTEPPVVPPTVVVDPPVQPPVDPPVLPPEPPVEPPVEPPIVVVTDPPVQPPGPPTEPPVIGVFDPPGEDPELPVEPPVIGVFDPEDPELPGTEEEQEEARGMLGGLGKSDFKNFMASIDYVAPILRELNIPLTDYISMWIKENK